MKALLLAPVVLALGVQAPAPDSPAPQPADVAPAGSSVAEPAPWDGTAVDGLAEIRRLASEERFDEAREVADRILVPHGLARLRARADERAWTAALVRPLDPALEALGWNGPPERTRAEVRYADGVTAALAGAAEDAVAAFEGAASLAGPGTLRLEALYDRGAVLLAAAEALRAQIPELQDPAAALAPAPVSPGAPGAPGGRGAPDEEEPPDFLELARDAYGAAKAAFVERLRADWTDEDTRANLELIQRRLRELDEIEQQREEQEEEQQDPEQSPEDSEQQGEEGEEGDEQQESEDQQDGSDEQESDEPSEQQEPQEPEESDEEGEESPQEEQDEPDPTAESEEESEEEAEESETAPEEAQASEEEERVLTREEVVRLLDRLREIDEEAEALRARLRQRGRVTVEKDW